MTVTRYSLVMSWPVPTIWMACPASSTTMGLQDHPLLLVRLRSPGEGPGCEHEHEEP